MASKMKGFAYHPTLQIEKEYKESIRKSDTREN